MNKFVWDSVRVLMAEIVDYAGLFPPSQVSMAEAVRNYARYKNSPENWMLGRFVVPVQRLAEFSEQAREFLSEIDSSWKLSVLAGENIDETVKTIERFNQVHKGKAVCDALEIKTQNVLEIENASVHLPEDFEAYFELPLNKDLGEMAVMLAIHRRRAKIRTGGVTIEAFPTPEQIVRFIRICLAANVPFKCTAGLHHPVRCVKPLTYEPDAATGAMHGFLNVFLATAFLRQGHTVKTAIEILNNEQATAFEFTDDGVLYQENFISGEQLKAARHHIISFGSCSFEEPIEDLREIGLL